MRWTTLRRLLACTSAALTLTLVTTSASKAQERRRANEAAGTDEQRREFRGFDTNRDGVLTGREIARCGCADYDRNRDARITQAEFIAGRSGNGRAEDRRDRDANRFATIAGTWQCSTNQKGWRGPQNFELRQDGTYIANGQQGHFDYDDAKKSVTFRDGALRTYGSANYRSGQTNTLRFRSGSTTYDCRR